MRSVRAILANARRYPGSFVLHLLCAVASVFVAAALVLLIGYILATGIPHLKPSLFAMDYNSGNVSLLPALFNTVIMTLLSLALAVPLGVGGAIYLAEYANRDSKIVKAVRLTAETLAGIPSILYGLFGMMFFVTSLRWSYSLLAGGMTLAVMILPLILRTTEEALLSIPDSYREGSFGLGAGRLRTVTRIVLPPAMSGILAGVILAIGRVVGETAALIYTAGTVADWPKGVMSSGRTLAVHMYVLSGEGLHVPEASATAVVLLVIVVGMNALSSYVALKDINLSIPRNRIAAFIGPSGCGKSTLLKTLNRMNDLVPGCRVTGKVLLDGTDVLTPDTDVNLLRKRVGMVFQKPNPFPMSVYDNIAYGPRTHGIHGRARLDELVEQSLRQAAIWDELKDRLQKSAMALSGGQQQRLCIARALAVQPEVLLMDEATSALDPISTGKIEELAVELKEQYTIVMVTHNMQQALRVSDQTSFFLLGEIVETGPTEKLFSNPREKRTEDYITGRFG